MASLVLGTLEGMRVVENRVVKVFLLGVLVMLAALGGADGKFFGSPGAAPVGVPFQRAVLMHSGDTEILAIQSVAATGEGDLAWVVPVPSRETRIGRFVAPEIFERTAFGGRLASIQNPMFPPLFVVVAGLAILVLLGWMAGSKPLETLAGLIALLFVCIFLSPAFAQSKSGGGRGVEVLRTFESGGTRAHLIQGDSVEALKGWLEENRTPLTPGSEPVVRKYIEEGWCFVAAKIRKSTKEHAAPEVLVLRFPSAKPVYPMRLTGVDAVPLRLDLVIQSPQRPYSCSQLYTLRQEIREEYSFNDFEAITVDDEFGEGPVWSSRLKGVLEPAKMQVDLPLEPAEKVEKTQTLYPGKSRLGHAVDCAFLPSLLLGVLAMVFPFAKGWGRAVFAILTISLAAMYYSASAGWMPWPGIDPYLFLSLFGGYLALLVFANRGDGKPDRARHVVRVVGTGAASFVILAGGMWLALPRQRLFLEEDGTIWGARDLKPKVTAENKLSEFLSPEVRRDMEMIKALAEEDKAKAESPTPGKAGPSSVK